jgi:hypothetical protein
MVPCNALLLNEFLFVNFLRKSLKAIEKIRLNHECCFNDMNSIIPGEEKNLINIGKTLHRLLFDGLIIFTLEK